ncbi:FtsB family cell division protein [Treponema socranskii]|uniref:FtsB family cell division protein n=1 Tax=Treponema socranskii TaxID=53419 RepID=UPI003D6FC72C
MMRIKTLSAFFAGTLVYVLLSLFAGRDGIIAYDQLQRQKRAISRQTALIQKIHDELFLERTALEKDKDVIAAYARKLDYVSEGEKLVKITGLRPYEAALYDTGTVIRRVPIAFVSERTCKACGIAFFALTFALLSLVGERGEAMARRKKSQTLTESRGENEAGRAGMQSAGSKAGMRSVSFGGGTP